MGTKLPHSPLPRSGHFVRSVTRGTTLCHYSNSTSWGTRKTSNFRHLLGNRKDSRRLTTLIITILPLLYKNLNLSPRSREREYWSRLTYLHPLSDRPRSKGHLKTLLIVPRILEVLMYKYWYFVYWDFIMKKKIMVWKKIKTLNLISGTFKWWGLYNPRHENLKGRLGQSLSGFLFHCNKISRINWLYFA